MGFGEGMNNSKKAGGAASFLMALIVWVPGVSAQAVATPQEAPRTIPGLVIAPAPTASATPVPVPSAPVRGLPTPAPTTTAVPQPASPNRGNAEPPTPHRSATPGVVPTPSPTPIPAPEQTALSARPAPTPAATPETVPEVAPAQTPVAAPVGTGENRSWPWIALALIVACIAAWLWLRRRSAPAPKALPAPEPEPERMPPPTAAPVPPVPSGPQPAIAIAFHPKRAGLNMLSAVVEGEVVVTNVGEAAATQVRVHATLLSAHQGQEADLAAAFAAPSGRPAAPPFVLAVGEERRVRIVAALPRDAVRSLEAGGRAMFVPLVAIDVRYAADSAGVGRHTGQGFVVGIERVDSAKLAPFWLDGPLRMFDQVAARRQGTEVTG